MFQKIGIIGLGLLGASVALAVKKNRLAEKVLGVDSSPQTIEKALQQNLITQASSQIDSSLSSCDFILLCTPVQVIIQSFPILKTFVNETVLISDVGSVKNSIVSKGYSYFKNFIGSHPLAGSEKSGLTHATADLFKESICIMTNDYSYDQTQWRILSQFWERIGLSVVSLSSEDHDRILSRTSHLPHILSAALVLTLRDNDFSLTSKGFEDVSRLAFGSPMLWTDILLSNKKNILEGIETFQEELSSLKHFLTEENTKDIQSWLQHASSKKRSYQQLEKN